LKPSFSRAFPPRNERHRQTHLTEHRTCDKGHGRITTRHLQASSRLAGVLNWPGLQQVCQIRRVTKAKGNETSEIAYAITSLSAERAGAQALLEYNRGHWGIESHHWVRDVSLGEDACRAKVGHSSHNLAAFRNVSLSLLRISGVKEILSSLRHFASRPYDLLKFLCIMKN
jgi:predicted transposase YbfD/YdcC